MKHAIITPKGTTYATLWQEDGMLKMELARARGVHITLDVKAIPQLQGVLEDVQKELGQEDAPKTVAGGSW